MGENELNILTSTRERLVDAGMIEESTKVQCVTTFVQDGQFLEVISFDNDTRLITVSRPE